MRNATDTTIYKPLGEMAMVAPALAALTKARQERDQLAQRRNTLRAQVGNPGDPLAAHDVAAELRTTEMPFMQAEGEARRAEPLYAAARDRARAELATARARERRGLLAALDEALGAASRAAVKVAEHDVESERLLDGGSAVTPLGFAAGLLPGGPRVAGAVCLSGTTSITHPALFRRRQAP